MLIYKFSSLPHAGFLLASVVLFLLYKVHFQDDSLKNNDIVTASSKLRWVCKNLLSKYYLATTKPQLMGSFCVFIYKKITEDRIY